LDRKRSELQALKNRLEKLREKLHTQRGRVDELKPRVAELPEPSVANASAIEAARQAEQSYREALATLYAAEREAGIEAAPAPGDPAASKGAYSTGVRSKFDGRIVGVKQVGDQYQVTFARGSGSDPSSWRDETTAVSESPVGLAPDTVATLELVYVGGDTPTWRLLKATAK